MTDDLTCRSCGGGGLFLADSPLCVECEVGARRRVYTLRLGYRFGGWEAHAFDTFALRDDAYGAFIEGAGPGIDNWSVELGEAVVDRCTEADGTCQAWVHPTLGHIEIKNAVPLAWLPSSDPTNTNRSNP